MDGQIITAQYGTSFIETTTAYTSQRFQAFQVNTACVITTLTITDRQTGTTYSGLSAYNATTNPYGQNLAARTLSAGMMIFVPTSGYISAITLSSGDVIAIRTY